jgi:hypothetical protein
MVTKEGNFTTKGDCDKDSVFTKVDNFKNDCDFSKEIKVAKRANLPRKATLPRMATLLRR